MKQFQQILLKYWWIIIIPLSKLVISIMYIENLPQFFVRGCDPEYIHFINGLNIAQLKFDWIGNTDNPGTGFQIYSAIIIRLTHLFTAKGNIAIDAFNRPEFYLSVTNYSMVFLEFVLAALIGKYAIQNKIKKLPILMLQSGIFLKSMLLHLSTRVSLEHFLLVVTLLFIVVYLKHGYNNLNNKKFAIYTGIIMGLGFATKFTYLIVILLPLFLIPTWKQRLNYSAWGIGSFFVFVSPIINKIEDYYKFLKGMAFNDGMYGTGESTSLSIKSIFDGFLYALKFNPELYLIIFAIVLTVVVIIFNSRVEKRKVTSYLGFLFIILLQLLMVSKQFKNYYLTPLFTIYGFILFFSYNDLSKLRNLYSNKLKYVISIFCLIVLLSSFRASLHEWQITKEKTDLLLPGAHFVEANDSLDHYWFVEPTWRSAPHVENALVFGLSYCAHRTEYFDELAKVDTKVITYEGEFRPVNYWRTGKAPLDSIILSETPIWLYDGDDRQPEKLMHILYDTASQLHYSFDVDTIFSNPQIDAHILELKPKVSDGTEINPIVKKRILKERKINFYIEAISSNEEWLKEIEKKAINKGITLDSMIHLDAIYMANKY